jgi:hypothetical protein
MTTTTKTTPTGFRELNAILDQAGQDPQWIAAISDDQLCALQRRWTTALLSRLDQAIEFAGPEPLIDTVGSAWRRLADEQATLRAVLDAAEPRSAALGTAMRAEFRYLALALGSVSVHDPDEEAIAQGRAQRDRIRTEHVQRRRTDPKRRPRTSSWRVFSRAA